jgi:hypothetical protein
LVGAYCQNLSWPSFRGEQTRDTYQPGDTYYSPLFVMSLALKMYQMAVHSCYDMAKMRREEAKGGTNVASILMQDLKDLGCLIEDKCGGRLRILMDNCGG